MHPTAPADAARVPPPEQRVAILFDYARTFLDFVEDASEPERARSVNSQIELDAGRLANRIAHELGDLAPDLLSLSSGTAATIVSFRGLFFDLIRQWEWDHVIGPNGEQVLADRQRQFMERRRQYLSVVRSYVEGCMRKGCVELLIRRDKNDANRAKHEQIPASAMSFDEVRAQRGPLWGEWLRTPYLAPTFPSCTADQFRAFEDIVRKSGAGVEGPQRHASQSERSPVEADTKPNTSTTPGSPPEAAREKETPDLPSDKVTVTMKDILTAVFALGALDLSNCRTFPEIVEEAGLSSHGARNVRAAYTRLKGAGLMKAKRGPYGGCWITAKGRRFIGKV